VSVGGTPAERHRAIAGRFTELVRGTKDWAVPTPVADWRARDVVAHLTEWSAGFLAGGAGVDLPAGPDAGQDPVGAWTGHADAVQAVLDDPGTADRVLNNPHVGELPLDVAIDRFYTVDVFLHSWDLARATGQADRLDRDLCEQLFTGMQPLDELLRSSGQYGPKVPVPDDADVQDRLLGFIGRDPGWSPDR
jgi:uncharacterized protein (TIGR03086 family)